MNKINYGWMVAYGIFCCVAMFLIFTYTHTCPETKDPINLIVGCDAPEQLIGKIVTEHHYNKRALDDVTAKFNACVMDLAVANGELPPLPGGE